MFCVSAGFAQMRVLPNGNVGIGTANPQHRLDVVGNARVSGNLQVARGIHITDAPTLTHPAPFHIMRTGRNDILLTRDFISSPYNGILLSGSGRTVLLGVDLDFFHNAWRTRNDWLNTYTLAVSAPWRSHGIGVNLHEAHYADGVRVILSMPCGFGGARPFTAYRDNLLIFYVNEFGDVFSRGNGTTSDLSQKENIEPIENALNRLM